LKGIVKLSLNITFSPKNRVDNTVPVAADINKGSKAALVKSNINTSIENTIAAIGALNTAANAAVDPHANSNTVFFLDKLNNLAKLEPIAEPVNTIGASNPTEPPKPTVMELATIDEYILCALNLPLLFPIAFNAMLTP
jgi:hypothetical protein